MKYVRRGVMVMMGMLLLAGCEKVSETKTEIKLLMVDEEEVVKEINSQLITIKAGTFMMGSPDSEKGRWKSEVQHKVTLTKEFKMGKYEVTQKQYQAIMRKNSSKFRGENLPVETVSWHEAIKFCSKLTELSRKVGVIGDDETYTLPTEAQWEYACRAGTTTPFHYGDSLSSTQANFDGGYPYGGAPKGIYRKSTTPVGSFKPNAWGLYDMHGNVYEWCQDWYDKYPAGPVTDPQGAASGSDRVRRGGSWIYLGRNCRSAFRNSYAPAYSFNYLGFRMVLVK